MKIVSLARAFGMFWWDFIVGDSLTLAVGVVCAVALTFILAHTAPTPVTEITVPLIVAATLGASLLRR
jgi:hypothetical protein